MWIQLYTTGTLRPNSIFYYCLPTARGVSHTFSRHWSAVPLLRIVFGLNNLGNNPRLAPHMPKRRPAQCCCGTWRCEWRMPGISLRYRTVVQYPPHSLIHQSGISLSEAEEAASCLSTYVLSRHQTTTDGLKLPGMSPAGCICCCCCCCCCLIWGTGNKN